MGAGTTAAPQPAAAPAAHSPPGGAAGENQLPPAVQGKPVEVSAPVKDALRLQRIVATGYDVGRAGQVTEGPAVVIGNMIPGAGTCLPPPSQPIRLPQALISPVPASTPRAVLLIWQQERPTAVPPSRPVESQVWVPSCM